MHTIYTPRAKKRHTWAPSLPRAAIYIGIGGIRCITGNVFIDAFRKDTYLDTQGLSSAPISIFYVYLNA